MSKQNNLFSTIGWWVLFEWGDIPRLSEHFEIEICVKQTDAKSQDICRALPNLDEAPLIMAWGSVSAQKVESGIQFNIYADSQKGIMNDRSWSQLMAQYDFLQQILSVKETPRKDIDIIWVGIDASIGSLGGAAGSQAFISNYAVNNNQVSQDSLSRLHWISGHEIFHLLSIFHYPLWISESLAHYYGYKSMSVGTSVQSPVEVWKSRSDKTAHSGTGLYKANEMVVNNKDMSYYGLFYDKGAAFWQELDNALVRRGSNLDAFISFLSDENTLNAQLNTKFLTAIENVLGKAAFSPLASKYLL